MMTEYMEKLIALQSALIARKQEICETGRKGYEYDVLCRDIDALEIIKQDLMTVYGMDTRRYDKWINK